jgi:Ca-activated chloride channel family protein
VEPFHFRTFGAVKYSLPSSVRCHQTQKCQNQTLRFAQPLNPFILAAVAAGAVLCAGAPGPTDSADTRVQPAQRPPRALRSSIELTAVTATVRDADGRLVADLPVDAFTVYEDGIAQAITQFAHERVPVGLGLLLDISDSMFGQRIRDARAAVERFLLQLLAPDDALFVMTFNHQPHLLTSWTTPAEAGTVRTALDTLRPFGGTAVYDAVLNALPVVASRPRDRAAIVIVSDGADTASDATLGDVRSALLRADAFVYAVAIDSPVRQAINTRVNAEALGEMTNQTGGHTEVVRDTADLAAATARIAEELNTQYVLGYSSPHPGDGKYHSIRVRVNREGYRVRSRSGYISVPVRKD